LFGSIVGASAFFAFAFTTGFIGFFLVAYGSSIITAWEFPWVKRVSHMEGPACFNPMYLTWLIENDRRTWAVYTTLWNSVIMAPSNWLYHLCVYRTILPRLLRLFFSGRNTRRLLLWPCISCNVRSLPVYGLLEASNSRSDTSTAT
jgi:hypothetical protein